jgi:predicted ribosomally synthesized peptide with SipW-like signal peptide
MKNFRAVTYERSGPLSDMFVARAVGISPIRPISHRATRVVAAALFIAALPVFFFPGGTLSYFSDDEHSTGNTFAAGPLGLTVTPDHTSATLFLNQAGETFVITPAAIAGSLPFRYKVSGAASGNAAFCSAIVASGSAPFVYTGSTTSFTTSDTNILSPWSLTLSLPSPAPGVVDGQKCILDLTYDAYQEGGAVGTEYHDTEHVLLTLTADPPVITTTTQSAVTDVPPPTPESTTTVDTASTTGALPPVTPSGGNPPPADTGSSTPPTDVPPSSQSASSTPSVGDVAPPAPEVVPPPSDETVPPSADTLPADSTPAAADTPVI